MSFHLIIFYFIFIFPSRIHEYEYVVTNLQLCRRLTIHLPGTLAFERYLIYDIILLGI